MHHGQGSAFVSYNWTGQLLLKDDVRPSYAVNGAKDNPEMESFNIHFKGENSSLFLEAQTLSELISVVDAQVQYYNIHRRHSGLGYVSLLEYIDRTRSDSLCDLIMVEVMQQLSCSSVTINTGQLGTAFGVHRVGCWLRHQIYLTPLSFLQDCSGIAHVHIDYSVSKI